MTTTMAANATTRQGATTVLRARGNKAGPMAMAVEAAAEQAEVGDVTVAASR